MRMKWHKGFILGSIIRSRCLDLFSRYQDVSRKSSSWV